MLRVQGQGQVYGQSGSVLGSGVRITVRFTVRG